jgi:hypothetical protein
MLHNPAIFGMFLFISLGEEVGVLANTPWAQWNVPVGS